MNILSTVPLPSSSAADPFAASPRLYHPVLQLGASVMLNRFAKLMSVSSIGIGGLVLGAVVAALGLLHRRRSKAIVLDIDPADPVPQTVERHASDSNPEHNFYLLHRDGGSAPVAVYRGVERPVMEMPPQYSSEGDPSVTQGSPRAEDLLGQAGMAVPMPQPARPRKTSRPSEKLGVVN